MTTAVQHRRGTTAEHATFTGLEGEVTIDTTKDTAVIHDGVLAGGVPLARENLVNVTPSGLATITGASTASDDKFFIYDQSATTLKSITRAELNNAMEIDALANVTITGGTINGTTIGNTTAAAGTFTNLTASGTVTIPDNAISGDKVEGGTINAITINTLTATNNPTLSAGTANGVTYLNGSKVLTSGSALTFDGAQTFKIRQNTNGLGNYSELLLDVSNSFSGTGQSYLRNLSLNAGNSSTALVFGVNADGGGAPSEAMRLTSTSLYTASGINVGIGVSLPVSKLQVNGITTTTELNTANDGIRLQSNFVTKSALNVASATNQGVTGTAVGDFYQWTTGGKILWSTNNGTTADLVLDSSGNLGIGTSSLAGMKLVAKGATGYPATSGTTQTGVLRLAGGTGLYNVLDMGVNESTDTAWMQATRANSLGTYDNLVINPYGGNVGIGLSSPGARLHVTSAVSGSYGAIIYNTHATGQGLTVRAGSTSSQDAFNAQTYDGGTSLLTVQAGGNVGIGTSSPSSAGGSYTGLDIRGSGGGSIRYGVDGGFNMLTYATGSTVDFVTSAAGDIRFFNKTATGESLRITSSGNLLVGTPDGYGKFTVLSTAGTGKVLLDNYATVPTSENVMSIYADASRGYIQSYNNGYKDIAICSSGGNVGIGTGSPTSYARLTVSGTAGDQKAANQQIVINAPTTTAGQGAGIRFNAASGSKEAVGVIGVVNEASGNDGAMTFHVYNGGGDIPEYMRIDSEGSVGIGTSSPGASLDVFNTASAGDNVAARFRTNFNSTDGLGVSIEFGDISPTIFGKIMCSNQSSSTQRALTFSTYTSTGNLTEKVRIEGDGNLLAGATSTSGSTNNYARIVGGVFSSLKGDLSSLATNTSYTLFDAGAAYSCYLVTVIGIAADAVNYSATAVVNIQNTSVSISYIDAGGLIFITNSGTAIRVNQNSGGTMGNLHWTALKIA